LNCLLHVPKNDIGGVLEIVSFGAIPLGEGHPSFQSLILRKERTSRSHRGEQMAESDENRIERPDEIKYHQFGTVEIRSSSTIAALPHGGKGTWKRKKRPFPRSPEAERGRFRKY
jgi:hypothetical protein